MESILVAQYVLEVGFVGIFGSLFVHIVDKKSNAS